MATTTIRQPFAPLNGSRLQNLTSLKNRQNAISLTSPTKRKATTYEDDAENIDPIIFFTPKKSKGDATNSLAKPTNFFLTRAPPSPETNTFCKPVASPVRRPILAARSAAPAPAPRLETSMKTTLTAPAGRSPTRKRIGILHRHRTAASSTYRVNPPRFSTPSSGLGFSIDAALSGTISSYKAAPPAPVPAPTVAEEQTLNIPELYVAPSKDSWFFEIHEDTEAELATNLMEHGACTLDISSDEESSLRSKNDRGKENVPPMDDISQTRTVLSDPTAVAPMSKNVSMRERRRREIADGACDVDRSPLGEMAAEDFFAEGCDAGSVFLIAEEEEEAETDVEDSAYPLPTAAEFDFVAETKGKGKMVELDIDELMRKNGDEAVGAALLQPLEKAEEGFELWESGSAKDGE